MNFLTNLNDTTVEVCQKSAGLMESSPVLATFLLVIFLWLLLVVTIAVTAAAFMVTKLAIEEWKEILQKK